VNPVDFDRRVAALENELAELKAKLDLIPAFAPSTAPAVAPGVCANCALVHPRKVGKPCTWSITDIGKLLESINMGKYTKAFEDAPIDGNCLQHVDDETLRQFGVSLAAHRAMIIRKIRELFGLSAAFKGERLIKRLLVHSQLPSHRPLMGCNWRA
jgi:hypothetical protein